LGEALGLNEALDLVKRLNPVRVTLEMDSLVNDRAMQERCEPRWSLGGIVKRCFKFLKQNTTIKISWARFGKKSTFVTL
jgi:ribonuclease HI